MKWKTVFVKNIKMLTEEEMGQISFFDFVTDGREEACLDFPMRVFNILQKNNFLTLKDLMGLNEEDYWRLRGFGENCLKDLREALSKFNITLKKKQAN